MTPATPELTGIAAIAVDIMEALGGPGVALVVFLENVFPPIPSEVVLPVAGFAASTGQLRLVDVLIWTTIGSVVGALLLYGLGRWLGHQRVERIAARIPLVDSSDIDLATSWFRRHGTKAIFFGRMVPLVRTFVSVPAGTERVRLWLFTLLTAAGSLIWNSVLVIAGYVLGENWPLIEPYSEVLQYLVIAGLVIAVAVFVIKRLRRRRRDRGASGVH